MRRWTIALCGLWLCADAAVGGTIGAPFLVNPERVVSAQPSAQYDRIAASNGSNVWLAVWSDSWTGEICGMRLDAQGNPLDAAALPIAPQRANANAFDRRYPSVTWQGDAFWVVWQERVYAGIRQGFGRRIAADGMILDPEPFSIEDTALNAYYPSVCGGASSVLTTWSLYSSGYRLWARVFTPEGTPVGVSTQVATGLSSYTYPGVAFGDFESGQKCYLVTYSLGSRIRGTRIAENGVALDDTPLAIGTNASTQYAPWPAFGRGPGGAQGWWVIWTDQRNGNNDIYGAFVAQDGTVSHSSTGLPIVVQAADQSNPSLAWDGARFLIGWRDYREPRAVRASAMDALGVAADPDGVTVATNQQTAPMVSALDAGRFLAVHGSDKVFSEVITVSGSTLSVGTQAVASVSGALERYTSGACDGTNYWVAFEYHPAELERQGDIALQRISPVGKPLLASPILVCDNSENQWGPSVTLARDAMLAVWEDERNVRDQIWGRVLTRSGQPVGDELQIGVSSLYAYFHDAASDGTNFFVVWDDAYSSDYVRGRFIQADGSMGEVLTVASGEMGHPSVVFGGGYYLVAWVRDDTADTVRFRRYRPDGTALDPAASNFYPGASGCWETKAAYNPDNDKFLVTWRDQATYQIMARTLDATTAAIGNVMTAAVLNLWSGSENSAVAYDGQDWLCLFRDTRGGLTSLFGVRIQGDGTVLDETPFAVLEGARFGSLTPPVGGRTNVLVLGTRMVYEAGGQAYCTPKTIGTFWQPGPQPTQPGEIEGQGVWVGPDNRMSLSFSQATPPGTGYVIEACANLAAQDWQAIANGVWLDSGVGVTVEWREPSGPAAQRVYRVTGAP